MMRLSIRELFKNLYKHCECKYCDCLIPVINKRGNFAKYKQGHTAHSKPNPNFTFRGRKHSDEAINRWKQQTGINNRNWKEFNELKLNRKHIRIKLLLEKSNSCQLCNIETSKLDLANKSGNYSEDINDWYWLCRRCHVLSDGRINNLRQYHK